MSSAASLCRNKTLIPCVINLWRRGTIAFVSTTTTAAAPAAGTATTTTSILGPYSSRRYLSSQNYRSFNRTFSSMDPPEDVFHGVSDRFNGVTIDGRKEPTQPTQFSEKLQKSLDYWIAQKKRAIWFHVYKEQADWVPQLTQAGFDFHHARFGVVTLYRWLPIDESMNLPHYAHTLIGVGGLVINERNEVLVVSDKNALVPNIWKLPGGYVEPNEHLVDAAIREVQEETGIRTLFRSMICLRHSHSGNFDCSDIYVVIGLKPISLELQRCSREIERVRWMPLDEYMSHPQVLDANRLFVSTYLDNQRRGLDFTCVNMVHQKLKKEYQLYYIGKENKDAKDLPQVPKK